MSIPHHCENADGSTSCREESDGWFLLRGYKADYLEVHFCPFCGTPAPAHLKTLPAQIFVTGGGSGGGGSGGRSVVTQGLPATSVPAKLTTVGVKVETAFGQWRFGAGEEIERAAFFAGWDQALSVAESGPIAKLLRMGNALRARSDHALNVEAADEWDAETGHGSHAPRGNDPAQEFDLEEIKRRLGWPVREPGAVNDRIREVVVSGRSIWFEFGHDGARWGWRRLHDGEVGERLVIS